MVDVARHASPIFLHPSLEHVAAVPDNSRTADGPLGWEKWGAAERPPRKQTWHIPFGISELGRDVVECALIEISWDFWAACIGLKEGMERALGQTSDFSWDQQTSLVFLRSGCAFPVRRAALGDSVRNADDFYPFHWSTYAVEWLQPLRNRHSLEGNNRSKRISQISAGVWCGCDTRRKRKTVGSSGLVCLHDRTTGGARIQGLVDRLDLRPTGTKYVGGGTAALNRSRRRAPSVRRTVPPRVREGPSSNMQRCSELHSGLCTCRVVYIPGVSARRGCRVGIRVQPSLRRVLPAAGVVRAMNHACALCWALTSHG